MCSPVDETQTPPIMARYDTDLIHGTRNLFMTLPFFAHGGWWTEVVRPDNLNTHQHEACAKLGKRLDITLRRMLAELAEIELSVFKGCLNRRISDEQLRREVAALERERNAAKSAIDWLPPKMLAVSYSISTLQDQIETVLGSVG